MAKQNILIVDSDSKSLRVLEVSLKKAGYSVTKATNGVDALEKVRLSIPDLVISDTNITEMNGFEFCTKLKNNEEWASIPFIFLTAQKSIEDKIRGLELGVDDYLTKPIFIREILARVGLSLQRRQKERLERRGSKTKFSGNLADMGMVDLIQTIDVSRKSGIIRIVREGDDGEIHFRDGKVIDAKTRSRKGADAVYRMLVWSDGTFDIEFSGVDRDDVIELSTQGLLMEGMRRLDEWGRLQEQLPPLTAVFDVDEVSLAESLNEIPDQINGVIKHIDGRSNLMEVLDRCDYGDLESLSIIAKLYFEGLIIEVERDAQGKLRRTKKGIDLSAGSSGDGTDGFEFAADGGWGTDGPEKNTEANTLKMRPVDVSSSPAPRLSIAVRRAGVTDDQIQEISTDWDNPPVLPTPSEDASDMQPAFPPQVFEHAPTETEAERIAAVLDAEAPPPSGGDPQFGEKEEYFEGEAYRAVVDKQRGGNGSVRLGEKTPGDRPEGGGVLDEVGDRQEMPKADSNVFRKVATALFMGAILVCLVTYILWNTALLEDFVGSPADDNLIEKTQAKLGVQRDESVAYSTGEFAVKAKEMVEGSRETSADKPEKDVETGIAQDGAEKNSEYMELVKRADSGGVKIQVELLRKAISVNPNGDEALAKLSVILAESKKTRAEALSLAQRAIAANPDNAAAWLAMGYVLQLEGDKEASRRAYEKCAACEGPKMHVKECSQLID